MSPKQDASKMCRVGTSRGCACLCWAGGSGRLCTGRARAWWFFSAPQM